MRACVSPPHARTSHIVVTTPSIAQAASTALPPFWNIIAPAVAPRGFPVIASQCAACSGGFCVRAARSGPVTKQRQTSRTTRHKRRRDLGMDMSPWIEGLDCARVLFTRFSPCIVGERQDARSRRRVALESCSIAHVELFLPQGVAGRKERVPRDLQVGEEQGSSVGGTLRGEG